MTPKKKSKGKKSQLKSGQDAAKPSRKTKAETVAAAQGGKATSFSKGDRVRLLKTLGGFPPGSEGYISNVNSTGMLVVTIDREVDCTATLFPLPPQPAAYFSRATHCK